jgi:D-alanine-D-alanine ligase
VLVEEKIVGRETTVGIFDGNGAAAGRSASQGRASLDYRNKYTAGATEYFCPADFDAATTRKASRRPRLGAFRAIGGRDYARVDVMVRRTVRRWCWR